MEAERDQDTFNSNVVVSEGKLIQSPRKIDSVTKENRFSHLHLEPATPNSLALKPILPLSMLEIYVRDLGFDFRGRGFSKKDFRRRGFSLFFFFFFFFNFFNFKFL